MPSESVAVPESSLLLTTAQIGMALAGFAGLITVLGRPLARQERLLNEIRFRSMVELSLALVAFCLLPFVPAHYGVSQATLWRLCSGIYALAVVLFVGHGVWRNRRQMGRVRVAGSVTTFLIGTGCALALFLALNASGLFADHEPAGYFTALFVHFLAAAFFFLRLLYAAMPRDGEPAA
jgi:hypothetical protein